MKYINILFLLLFFIPIQVKANNFSKPVFDGSYYDWNVYFREDVEGNKECYIVSFTKDTIGNYPNKKSSYMMVLYIKAKEKEEFSIFADYILKKNSMVYISIDKTQFKLGTKDKSAWPYSTQEDNKIIKTLMKSEEIKVRAESLKNEYTVDTYSGKGFLMAYNKMRELCK